MVKKVRTRQAQHVHNLCTGCKILRIINRAPAQKSACVAVWVIPEVAGGSGSNGLGVAKGVAYGFCKL